MFRVAFAYFAMFGCASLLDSGPSPRALLAHLRDPVVRFVGNTLLRIHEPPRSSGIQWAVVQQVAAFGVAIAIAALWSLASRRREYDRLHGWSRIVLRYYVAVAMMVYGSFKIIDTQFPPISLDTLAAPVGAMSPMALLWTYMGYSSTYAAFTGFGESLGAFLLFFRRTTTAGSLLLCAVLSNVALINYVYDVPVKQLSTNLLLAVIVLASGDLKRLMSVFVFNTPTPAADISFAFPNWFGQFRRFAKPVLIVGAACGPLVASFLVHRSIVKRPPLYGIYDVERFTRNRADAPPLASDSTRWRRIVFSRPGTMSVRMMTDSTRMFASHVDTARRRIVIHRSSRDESAFAYERIDADRLRLQGRFGGDSLDVIVRRLDERAIFRLQNR
jgi:hypothetical protein